MVRQSLVLRQLRVKIPIQGLGRCVPKLLFQLGHGFRTGFLQLKELGIINKPGFRNHRNRRMTPDWLVK